MSNQDQLSDLPKIKGLLFDKDGTLFDYQTTWGPWAEKFISHLSEEDPQIAKLISESLGFNRNTESFLSTSKFISGTTEEVLNVVLSAIPSMTRKDLEAFYLNSTSQATLSPPVPLEPLLKQFQKNNIKLGVATNDHESTARNHLKKANINSFFDFIVGFDSGYGAKPEPGMQFAFCDYTNLNPKEVVMVGDTLHDIESGSRAGMITIGVLTGMSTREELESQATIVLNNIGEIPELLNL